MRHENALGFSFFSSASSGSIMMFTPRPERKVPSGALPTCINLNSQKSASSLQLFYFSLYRGSRSLGSEVYKNLDLCLVDHKQLVQIATNMILHHGDHSIWYSCPKRNQGSGNRIGWEWVQCGAMLKSFSGGGGRD
jgi:hypothetical protein